MQAPASTAAFFGKTPGHGDFVQHRASSPVWRDLDSWIQQGLAHAMRVDRTGLTRAVEEAADVCFLYTPKQGEEALVGVLHPSSDRAGRTYPFAVGVEEPVSAVTGPWAPHLPVQQADFFRRARQFARDSVQGQIEYWSLADHVDPVTASKQPFGVSEQHKRYLQHTPFRTVIEATWGDFDDSRKYLLFKNALDVLLPFRNEPDLNISLGFRFPLPTGDIQLHAAAFWWELCYRLVRRRPDRPTCFWAGGQAPFLLSFFRHPPPSALTEMMGIDQDDDRICDLVRMGAADAVEAVLAIPPHYGTLLESDQITLWEFLCRV